ncbi:MAG: hypothetical protein IJL66_03405 [Lachnospiraceae bacterium]|nr:hypothetical protein [Lachnospiraceae bacterium]
MSSRFYLCSGPLAKTPFALEEGAVHVFSAEELCYYIDRNVLLIEQDFFSDALLQFVRDDLRMPELAEKVRRSRETDTIDQQMLLFLSEVGYHTEKELEEFLKATERKKLANPWETQKNKADYMVDRGHYESALRIYDALIEHADRHRIPAEGLADLYRNRGVCLCRSFCFAEAADSLERAFAMTGDQEILKMLYGLKMLDPGSGILPEIFTAIDPQMQFAWKEEFEKLRSEAHFTGKSAQADAAFLKDSVRRPQAIRQLLASWKKECREMA